MKTVLVTGARGFVGNHLIKELASHEINAIGVDRSRDSSADSTSTGNSLALDLMDPAAVSQIDFHAVDGVIHLAGLAAVGPSFDAPMGYITTNIGIETNLFEAALQQGVKPRFLIISSGSLYDPSAPLPLTETSPVAPSSPYAVSKIGQEQMGYYYSQRGFKCVIARPFNHIGPGQNPGFIVPDLTKQIIDVANGTAEQIMVGNLDAKRDYTDVRDIVRAYRLLLEKGTAGEVYNICSGTTVSGHELLAQIAQAAGVSPKIVSDPDRMRPSDTPVIYGDHSKLTTDTGWQPEIKLEQTITDCVADWRARF